MKHNRLLWVTHAMGLELALHQQVNAQAIYQLDMQIRRPLTSELNQQLGSQLCRQLKNHVKEQSW